MHEFCNLVVLSKNAQFHILLQPNDKKEWNLEVMEFLYCFKIRYLDYLQSQFFNQK